MAIKHTTWFTGFIAVAILHLVGQLVGQDALHLVTKPLLMPALLAWFLTVTPSGRFRTLVAIGLVWSWLGDLGLMPSGEAWFLAGLGAFLIAQLTYSVAFWPYRADSVLTRPVFALPYLAVLVGLLVVLWGHLGDLRLPVTVYAVVIVAMAVLATGVNRTVALGAVLFVVSDALIALDSVADLVQLPAHGFWVMLTYLAAQLLIAMGVASAVRAETAG
ncbi:MAG: lysoplasmalogenase [Nitriliruptor sp.]|nr:MAG: lysoplasmalogenase [Nitriliruptor sp.]